MIKHFKFYSKHDVLNLTRIRRFETKLGESVHVLPDKNTWETALQQSTAKYVVFGIPEDLGIRANHGTGGADSVWTPAVWPSTVTSVVVSPTARATSARPR